MKLVGLSTVSTPGELTWYRRSGLAVMHRFLSIFAESSSRAWHTCANGTKKLYKERTEKESTLEDSAYVDSITAKERFCSETDSSDLEHVLLEHRLPSFADFQVSLERKEHLTQRKLFLYSSIISTK